MKEAVKYIPYAAGGATAIIGALAIRKLSKSFLIVAGGFVIGAVAGYAGSSYAIRKLSRHPEVGLQNN